MTAEWAAAYMHFYLVEVLVLVLQVGSGGDADERASRERL